MSFWDTIYRPKTIEELCSYDGLVKQLRVFEKDKDFPNLLLNGFTGTGKTTIARILGSVSGFDVKEINCNEMREKKEIQKLAKPPNSLMFLSGGRKDLVILDEFHLWAHKDQMLFSKVMEDYSEQIKYILCVNDLDKVAKPIQSRCRVLPTDVGFVDEKKDTFEMMPHANMSVDEWKKVLLKRAVVLAEKDKEKGLIKSYSTTAIEELLERPVYLGDIRTFLRGVQQQIKMDEL